MTSRANDWLSSLGFAAAGMAAAWLWVKMQTNEDVGAPPAEFRMELPQPVAPRAIAPTAAAVSPAIEAPPPARTKSAPSGATSLERSFRATTDYFAFAQRAAQLALAGDARAQYFLGRALRECQAQLGPVASMQGGSAAERLQAYFDLLPRPHDRALVAREIERCERFFDGSPLDGLAVPEDAQSSEYWLDRAVAARDPLAVLDRDIGEATSRHLESVPPEHRGRLLDDVRIAVASEDPSALFKVGTLYSSAIIARDATQGAAWLIAACEAGYDCSNANPEVGQGCPEHGICDAGSTLPQTMQEELGGERFAEIRAAAQDIAARIKQGDWDGLVPYLETR